MCRLLCVIVLLSALVAFTAAPAVAGATDPASSANGDHDIPQIHPGNMDWLGDDVDVSSFWYERGQGNQPLPQDLGSDFDDWTSWMVQIWLWLEGF